MKFPFVPQRGAFVSEPAIHVRRLTGSQVWSMEKLENKLIDMREMYQEYKDRPLSMMVNRFFLLKQHLLTQICTNPF